MKYVLEFLQFRLIVFLMILIVLSGTGVGITYGSPLTWLAIAGGIVLFGLIEYIVHRYIMHELPRLLPKAYEGHVAHHQHPNDDRFLFGSVWYEVVTYPLLLLLFWALTGELHLALSVVFGTVVCQMYYQWKHFVSHRPIVPLTPWGKWLKKKHLLHHYLDEHAWYGVSNPVMDVVMGTNKVAPDTKAAKRSLGGSTEHM
ncbi:hypothetical protein AV654_33530 [Paenibacillus elgii]|uniref:Fatty acid hydroxylase domain-containing protein n=1 Tax=Paenibacillus elgii TaxID=189691 RepID=A0A165PS60_9BACL|nr:sterol desaturase family protein [Paenibacillus elgii]KZE72342.1 hypothetical protein AV654_33530 [Paenibacillus elgii]